MICVSSWITKFRSLRHFVSACLPRDAVPTSPTPEVTSCPVCRAGDNFMFSHHGSRMYRRCMVCHAIFVPSKFWLPGVKERPIFSEMSSHKNIRMPNFLRSRPHSFIGARTLIANRVADALLPYIMPGDAGLDFGCGPRPVFSSIMSQQGARFRCLSFQVERLSQAADRVPCY